MLNKINKLIKSKVNINDFGEDHHFNKWPNHPWLKTKEEIREWIIDSFKCSKTKDKIIEDTHFSINDDLSVNFHSDNIYIEKTLNGYFPIKIKEAWNLIDNAKDLKSFIGSPEKANAIEFNDCNLKDFEGLSGKIKAVYVNNNSFEDFSNMSSNLDVYYFSLLGNPIKSWNGFNQKEESYIMYWSKEYNDEQKRLIMSSPESVVGIEVNWCKEDKEKLGLMNKRKNQIKMSLISPERRTAWNPPNFMNMNQERRKRFTL